MICACLFLFLSIYEPNCKKEVKLSFLHAVENNLRFHLSLLKNFPVILSRNTHFISANTNGKKQKLYVITPMKQICFLLQLISLAFLFMRMGYYYLCHLVSDG